MNALVNKAEVGIKEMAVALANFPAPDKWSSEQKIQAVRFAALLNSAQKMILAANIIGIDYEAEKETFLNNAGRTQSQHTRIAYQYAIGRLDTWASRQKINPLELTPAQSDDFIYSLKGERSAASIRLDVAGISSFFTFLERRHASVKNPFRGSKARPAKKAVKETIIPSSAEIEIMIKELPAYEAALVAIMAFRGLRAGALPSLSIIGKRFTGHSKGKDIKGELPPAALDAVKKAGLPLRKPFAGVLPNTLEKRIVRAIEKLLKDGKVNAKYSAHDLRHFYAVTEYRKDKDIYRVSKLLEHSSIQITEVYLKGLGAIE